MIRYLYDIMMSLDPELEDLLLFVISVIECFTKLKTMYQVLMLVYEYEERGDLKKLREVLEKYTEDLEEEMMSLLLDDPIFRNYEVPRTKIITGVTKV